MTSNSVLSEPWAAESSAARHRRVSQSWTTAYIRKAVVLDSLCALAAGALAFWIRLSDLGPVQFYLAATLLLPLVWLVIVSMVDGYDARTVGVGSDEFRRILNAGLDSDCDRCDHFLCGQGRTGPRLCCRCVSLADRP